MLSLLSVTGVFQFPRPGPECCRWPESAVPIPSQYHIKRLTPAPAPLLLLTIALLFDKENFSQIPLKIGKQQLSRHRQAMGEERERMSEVGPKTGISPVTSHNCGLRLTTGGLILFMKSGDLGPELGPDFPSHF